MLVKNWTQVYKSLAVWLPILGSGIFVMLQNTLDAGHIPEGSVVIVGGILGVLGWVIKQPNIKKH